MKRLTILLATLLMATAGYAQYQERAVRLKKWNAVDSLTYKIEAQGSFANGETPLWLNANKYGLSSLDKSNGYLRTAIMRPLSVDNERKLGLGYGLDFAVPFNYTSKFVVQQAYVEGRWLHGTLTIGAKEEPMVLKNNSLSSGSQTLGRNARPVPQVRLALPDYWTVPLTRGWLHLKGHIAFGKMTDDNWQESFTGKMTKYSTDLLYHSKAGYLKIGNPERFYPWSLELGLEMVGIFGGTSYEPNEEGGMDVKKGGTGLKDYWEAFVPGGADAEETVYQNVKGNQLGSWVAQLRYDGDWRSFSLYADKFFEDHSSMFQLDYDGYGEGDEWQVKKDHRYMLYDFKDWMLGMEYNYKPDAWLNDVVVEYIYTKYQSGPIYHDHTQTIADHIGGHDNFYNHYITSGYQHWGQVMGNPLYRSPIYNNDGTINVADNRFMAWHLGLGGHPSDYLRWRFLATWQEGLGTYDKPFLKKHHNASFLGEASYRLHSLSSKKWYDGIDITAGYGMDFGAILGGINYGFQLTVTKTGLLKF